MSTNTIFGSLRISIPFILTLISLYFAMFGQHMFDFEESIELSPLGFISFEHTVTETELRGLFGVFSVVFLSWGFLRDYSIFYPRMMKMRTEFDNEGLESILIQYQKDSRFNFDIYSDWKKKKQIYLQRIESEIYEKISKHIVLSGDISMSANGSTSFIVEKQRPFKQVYRVVEADGLLVMHDEKNEENILTLFHLLNTKDADIEVSLLDMLFRHTFFVSPKFSQTYRFDPTNEVRFDDLVATTKVRFFPAAIVGQSIYLVKGKNRWFPVGYCIYDF